jgi:hypothetical protein
MLITIEMAYFFYSLHCEKLDDTVRTFHALVYFIFFNKTILFLLIQIIHFD